MRSERSDRSSSKAQSGSKSSDRSNTPRGAAEVGGRSGKDKYEKALEGLSEPDKLSAVFKLFKEELQSIGERLFAQEKLLQRQIRAQEARFLKQERRMHEVEAHITDLPQVGEESRGSNTGSHSNPETRTDSEDQDILALKARMQMLENHLRSPPVITELPDELLNSSMDSGSSLQDNSPRQSQHGSAKDGSHGGGMVTSRDAWLQERFFSIEQRQNALEKKHDDVCILVQQQQNVQQACPPESSPPPPVDEEPDISAPLEIGERRKLEPRIWEAVVFVGLPQAESHHSATLLILLTANVLIQVFFFVIMVSSFQLSMLESDDFKLWRYIEGHSAENIDLARRSLLARVCEGSAQNELSILTLISEYTSVSIPQVQAGPTTCVLTLSICFFLWSAEFCKACEFCNSCHTLPQDLHTVLVEDKGVVTFSQIANARMTFLMCVNLLRMGVLTALLVVGSLWLLYTVDVEAMILNGAAFAFVFQTDGSLYQALVPRKIDIKLKCTEPLPIHGLPQRGVMTFVLYIGYVVAIIIGLVAHSNHLDALWQDACGGNRDFAVFANADLAMTFSVQTSSPGSEGATLSHTSAVEELISSRPESIKESKLLPSVAKFNMFKVMSGSEIAEHELADCRDTLPAEFPFYWEQMMKAFGTTGSSCSVLRSKCGDPNIALVRMLCPITCGCGQDKPFLAVWVGCPAKRCHYAASSAYMNTNIPCTDYVQTMDDAVRNSWTAFWQNYVQFVNSESFKRYEGDNPLFSLENANAHKAFALVSGCAVLDNFNLKTYLCRNNDIFQSVGSYCPVTCECHTNSFYGCPGGVANSCHAQAGGS